MVDSASLPQVVLGRTGLHVGRLALSAGYGIGPEGIELALERGQNLFYWGSLRRRAFGGELARQIRLGRERMVLAIQSYSRSAWAMTRSVESALRRLETDFADLLILGFWQRNPPPRIVERALELQHRGLVRRICVSTHDIGFARELATAAWVDALMIRYNAATRIAENLLDMLPEQNRPGILAFTSTRWGHLMDAGSLPPGEKPMTAADCYRFCLSHPRIDAVVCGPANLSEWREGLLALEAGAMNAGELERARRIGAHVAACRSFFYDFGSRAQ